MSRFPIRFCAWIVVAAAGFSVRAQDIQFNRDIRPILSDNCFLCHGPDKNHRKGKLRLDDRDAALKKEAFVPGHPDQSEVIKRILTDDEDDLMPPPDSGKHLTPAQKDLLKRWVAKGAEYQPHWAYVLPVRSAVPATKDKGWVRNPIDAFILHTLESKGIKPSAEADRPTLLRRLSLDLIGLPPTPAEVDAFVKDPSPDAYEKQVDRLLASVHFGERMAVGWLDLARFSDTVGYHGDQNQRIFPYRDYVINAFNANKRFDQFTVEQLAGDLLPNPTAEQRIATGFNRLNMVTREGGAQPLEYMAKYAADRVRTVSSTWMGSTMACNECHDHKYDPFTARDFYAMAAFFADVKQWGVYMDYNYTPNPDLRGFSNDHPFPPEIQVDSPYLQQRIARLNKQIDELAAASAAKRKADPQLAAAFDAWQKSVREFLQNAPTGWLTPPAAPATTPTKATGTEPAPQPDGSILFTHKVKKGDDQQLQLTLPAGWVSAIRVEALPHAKHRNTLTREGARNTTINVTASLKPKTGGPATRLPFYAAEADKKEYTFRNGAEVLGVLGGWRTSVKHNRSPQTSVWLLDKPVKVTDGEKLIVSIKSDNVGCVRVSVSPLAGIDALQSGAGQALAASPDKAYLLGTAGDPEAFAKYKQLRQDLVECRDGKAWTMVTESREPIVTRVLPRGNWQDETGEVVAPSAPTFLLPNHLLAAGPAQRAQQPATPAATPNLAKRATRLDLANWLMSKENPLTARTFVNRLWKQFYGNGLSAVVDDLGAQGEPPTHPELLDWLAVEFQDRWDVKHMVKLMVMSATYRQSSSLRPELRDVDPNNRLLASQNPRRLEAEFVRDNALFAAGALNLDVGGPSAFPYQPEDYYANLQFPTRVYMPNADDRQYRRGVYTHWQRTFMHPMLANFDAPSREECTAARNVSNTPQQALTLLNDPSFVEAARVFATKVLAGADNDGARIERAFRDALARPVKAKERDSLTKFLAEQRTYYKANVEDAKKLINVGMSPAPTAADPAELAAWTSLCRVVLNLHETITRY